MTPPAGQAVSSCLLSRVLCTTCVVMLALSGTEALYGQSRRAVTTVQYNDARTGWNPDETALMVERVNPSRFGKQWTATLDGHIYAAPLYVGGVMVEGQWRNAVYVATENNLIYAVDAETGAALWQPYFLGIPGSRDLLDCGSISPNIGITSTPVIDLDTGTLYAVGLVREGDSQLFRMAAVDIATGLSRSGWPVTIRPPASPDTRVTSNRGALLLANGRVYIPFGGYAGDCGRYHGWVVSLDKSNPMAPPLYWRTLGTDDHRGSGIWAPGGLAADESGQIYAATGNSFAAPALDYSNGVLRLAANLSFSGQPRDFFVPSNWSNLNDMDLDLGSSAPMLLPIQPGWRTPKLIFIAGKYGVGHLLDREHLGGVGRGNGIVGEGVFSFRIYEQVLSSGVYYNALGVLPLIFVAGRGTQPVCGTEDGVAALRLGVTEEGDPFFYPLWCTPSSVGVTMPPVVTSAPGQIGVLWVVSVRGVLYAFNTVTGELLYDSARVPGDALGPTRSLSHFTVIDGKVFVANADNQLVAYGLR